MKLAYVAGSYRANSEWGLVVNIRMAEIVASHLWRAGFAVLCPHKNTAHFGGLCPDKVFLDGDLEMLSRCDLVVVTEDYKRSIGTLAEIEFAIGRGTPVFYSVKDAVDWLASQPEGPK